MSYLSDLFSALTETGKNLKSGNVIVFEELSAAFTDVTAAHEKKIVQGLKTLTKTGDKGSFMKGRLQDDLTLLHALSPMFKIMGSSKAQRTQLNTLLTTLNDLSDMATKDFICELRQIVAETAPPPPIGNPVDHYVSTLQSVLDQNDKFMSELKTLNNDSRAKKSDVILIAREIAGWDVPSSWTKKNVIAAIERFHLNHISLKHRISDQAGKSAA